MIEHPGSSPCSFACPAGVKAHGYVSLVRAGRYEEAFNLHMEDAPLPGSLARACYAPCEESCTRGEFEGPVPIRAIKRFMVDRYYENHPKPEYGPPETILDKKVAVVGSGPAGLSAAYHLGKKGYQVTIFEGAPEPGGMLRYGIPAYRLPKDVVDRDIANITALGVDIKTRIHVTSMKALKDQGFDAVFLAVGTNHTWKMHVPGEELEGVMECMDFLSKANTGTLGDLTGKTVVVVGGGNSAIDPSRMAIRMGAKRVVIMYRRSRNEMPAHDWEVKAALDEGVELQVLKTPKKFIEENGHIAKIEVLQMKLGEPDDSGRRRPIPQEGSEFTMPVDLVVLAIGLRPCTLSFKDELEENRNETIKVNEETLETSMPSVFAGGDGVTGPTMIVNAIGQGKRAAFYIDRYLQDKPLDGILFDNRLPEVDKKTVIKNAAHITRREPLIQREIPPHERIHGFEEVECCISEEDARNGANRCLDCGTCSECLQCVKACPADAIHFSLRSEEQTLEVGSVIVSTGFKLFDAHLKYSYGFGRYPNVITAMQMDRILAPTKPYNAVLRPSDGKKPDNIAFVLCTGSRDRTLNNPLCSRVCCMYSIKQAQLTMGASPLADITIYYIDIRAFGKGYEEFYQQAKEMGTYFVKGRVSEIEQKDDGNLVLHYEDIESGEGHQTAEHDMVVLSVGLMPNREALSMFKENKLEADPFAYVKEIEEDINPGKTSIDGVFVAGTASAARDIPDTILHAGSAAAQAASYLKRSKKVS